MKSIGKETKKVRIGTLDENTLSYYRRVSAALDEGFETDEEKGLFIRNVFSQLLKELTRVARNQTVSKIVEKLLELTDASQCSATVDALVAGGDDWEVVCRDRFASHVLQAAVARSSEFVAAGNSDVVSSLSKLSSAVCTSGADLVTDTYASHIVRVLVEVTAGVEVAETLVRSRLSRENPRKILFPFFEHSSYEEFKSLFTTLSEKLFPADKHALFALAKDPSSNPVMQTLLAVVRQKDPILCSSICQRLLAAGGLMDRTDGSLPSVLTNEISSYLFESLLGAVDDDVYAELFNEHLKERVPSLAAHPVANFVLQRVLTTLRTESQFKTMARSLCRCLEDVLANSHTGIVVRLFETSRKYPKRQAKLVRSLLKAFHCYSPVDRRVKVTQLVLELSTYEAFCGDSETGGEGAAYGGGDSKARDEEKSSAPGVGVLKTVTYQGSLLLQQLLRLEAAGAASPFVDSLLAMKPAELFVIGCSPCGSHALDAFLDSPVVLGKQKEALWKKLQPLCADICCDKHGSRVMDRLWAGTSKRVREEVAAAMGAVVQRLMSNSFGRILCNHFAINQYLHGRRDWDAAQTLESKKRKLAEGFVDLPAPAAANPGKKSKQSRILT